MISFKNRDTFVAYVSDLLWGLKPNSVLTMTILRDRFGDCSVISVTEELSEDTEPQQNSSDPLMNI